MGLSRENRSILLVEPSAEDRVRAVELLSGRGYRVATADHASEVAERLERRSYDAIVLSLRTPADQVPSDRVRHLRRLAGSTPLLVLCDPADVERAVRCLRHGADDYLLRSLDRHELRVRLERIVERSELNSRIAFFQDELSKKHGYRLPEAHSRSMRAVLARLGRVAPTRSTVLVVGESGVGKELIARAIHFNSPRRDGPFIALNCAAIPPGLIESELFGHERGSFTGAHTRARGKFEIAHGGTLFLDEIGEMDPSTQVKLLRVLEEREIMRVGGQESIRIDVRVIAATNADLDELVDRSDFRRDLYYRLKVVTIAVPPLRERRADIPALVDTFLEQLSRDNAVPTKAISPEALAALQDYRWPGNVRELKNLLESALVSVPGGVVRLEDLPDYVRRDRAAPESSPDPGTTLAQMERDLIRRTLEHTGGNRTHAASMLDIGVRTLQRKIRAYDLEIPPRRRRRRRDTAGSPRS